MKIYKVNLKNFKGIRNASIKFGDLTVITGKNSSGKSSIIQSLKYLTQWFKRIERTRDLNPVSAPSLNVIHQDFIDENKNYEAIRNSKSEHGEGISLGVEFSTSYYDQHADIEMDFINLNTSFESVAQQGEKVRPKEINISSTTLSDDEEIVKYDVIYNNALDPELVEKKRKYIEMFTLGEFAKQLNEKRSLTLKEMELRYSAIKNQSYLHDVEITPSRFDNEINKVATISSLNSPSQEEEALIINKYFERLFFEVPRLKIKKVEGFENFFFFAFKNYVADSLKASGSSLNQKALSNISVIPEKEILKDLGLDRELIGELLILIKEVYHLGYSKLLGEYLQENIVEDNWHDFPMNSGDPATGVPPMPEPTKIDGLDEQFIKNRELSPEISKILKKITKIVNESPHPDELVTTTQILLLFINYFNKCISSSKARALSDHINKLIDSEELQSRNIEDQLIKNPIRSIIEIQNILGESSEILGSNKYSRAMREGDIQVCECPFDNAYDEMYNPFRQLQENEVIRSCPTGDIEHIYRLTTVDEISSGEPNSFTLNQFIDFRTRTWTQAKVVDILDEIIGIEEFVNNKSISPLIASLAIPSIKQKEIKEGIKHFELTEEESSLRERIIKLEDQVSIAQNALDDETEDYVEYKQSYDKAKEDLDKYKVKNELYGEEYNSLLAYLQSMDQQVGQASYFLQMHEDTINEAKKEKENLLKKLNSIKKELSNLKIVDEETLRNISIFMNTISNDFENNSFEIDIDCLSTDLKYLNTGRNPSSEDRAGEFFDNLTVGKIGGRLSELMYEEANTPIEPFLFPSLEQEGYSRNFEDLNWHTIPPDEEVFSTAFNKWVSYLEMEISKITSEMDGPRPRIKVRGKDGKERDVFEVGSGVGQVLPVIAICLLAKPGEVVCIEEPEAHLHPSAQAYIADFLLSMAASGRQIIIETHSPNIIDRLRLRKAHTKSWKKLVKYDWLKSELNLDNVKDIKRKFINFITPEIKIIFAEQNKEGNSEYNEASIDSKGDVIFNLDRNEVWPEGFFDTAQEELSYILEARISSEEE